MSVFQNFKQIIKKQELDIQRLYNQACAHIQENSFEAAEQNLKQIQLISNKDIRWMRGLGIFFTIRECDAFISLVYASSTV